MGWRFRKSVKILPGVRLNFGKKGLTSASIGSKYAKTNISKRGTYNTFSLPGTGISYRTELNKHHPVNSGLTPTPCGICSRCGAALPPNGSFCGNCGGGCISDLRQPARLGLNDGKHLTILLVGFIGLAGFLSLVGAILQKPFQTQKKETYQSVQTVSQPVPEPQANAEKPTSEKQIQEKPVFTSQYTVLRKSPNQKGEAIQVLPEGETVEVISQKSGWFNVRVKNQTGWVQGSETSAKPAESNYAMR